MKLLKKNSVFCIIYLLLYNFLNAQITAQSKGIENLPVYDLRKMHFGFVLGINEMNFSVKRTTDTNLYDSLLILTSEPQWGFHIGIITDLRLAEYFNLRFIPTLSFGDRILNYTILKNNQEEKYIKKVESSFLDFPLLLKYKSSRLTNTRAYIIGGIKYSVDMASMAKKKTQEDEIIKLKKHDFTGEIGVGFDFYLKYFKFGTEIKMAYGLKDLMIRENTIYTNSIDKLNTKIFYLSFTFE